MQILHLAFSKTTSKLTNIITVKKQLTPNLELSSIFMRLSIHQTHSQAVQ